MHNLCSTTEQKILRLFEAHRTRCNIAAELWNFENVKQFVQQGIGLAIVPRATVLQELATAHSCGSRSRVWTLLDRTLMMFRAEGYVSDSAQQFIDLVKGFDWARELPHASLRKSRRGGVGGESASAALTETRLT